MESQQEPIKCYSDASFSPKHKIAVIGWKIESNACCTQIIHDTTNTRAEFLAILDLINHLDNTNKYIIFTDCAGVINCLNKQEKLVGKNFKNKHGKNLSNGDLYKQLFDDLKNKYIVIKQLPGHMAVGLMNPDNVLFSHLDKTARKELRQYVSAIGNIV